MKFSQLSEEAKQRARANAVYDDWWGSTYEDFLEVASRLGFVIERKQIWFSGFCSQGDGASFAGTYQGTRKHTDAITEHAPEDEELRRIAGQLDALAVAARLAYNCYWWARIYRSGHYHHSGSMHLDEGYLISAGPGSGEGPNAEQEVFDHAHDTILQAAKDLANWLYKTLEAEHDYLTGDECLEQYEYNEEGCTI